MIRVTLSSANMGPVDEADFDEWAVYVLEHLGDATGLDVEIDQFRFTGRGAWGEDVIVGGTEQERDTIRRWLGVDGWTAFCADESAWPAKAVV